MDILSYILSKKYTDKKVEQSVPKYVALSFYNDGDTGVLTDQQVQVLSANELNYIWLNGMHKLDFRYRDDNNNKATYSAFDTSSDGSKTHSVEINLTTKAFTVYHKTLQEKLVLRTSDNASAFFHGTGNFFTSASYDLIENYSKLGAAVPPQFIIKGDDFTAIVIATYMYGETEYANLHQFAIVDIGTNTSAASLVIKNLTVDSKNKTAYWTTAKTKKQLKLFK